MTKMLAKTGWAIVNMECYINFERIFVWCAQLQCKIVNKGSHLCNLPSTPLTDWYNRASHCEAVIALEWTQFQYCMYTAVAVLVM